MGRVERGEELTEQVNGYIEALQAELAEGHTERFLSTLDFYSKFHKYSFGNACLIYSQMPTATLVAGYRKWQELGFQVKRGETGIFIRAPWLRKEIDETTGEKKERLIGYFATCVFDISQTEEWPDKQPPELFLDPPGDYDELFAHLHRRVIDQGVVIEEMPLTIGHNGYCVLGQNKIVLNESLTAYQKATCLVHEYVHHICHEPAPKTKQLVAEREWEAESVAYVVCRAIGIENVNSRDYLLTYRLTTDRLAEMLQFIQKTTKQVLADLDLLQPVKQAAALAAD